MNKILSIAILFALLPNFAFAQIANAEQSTVKGIEGTQNKPVSPSVEPANAPKPAMEVVAEPANSQRAQNLNTKSESIFGIQQETHKMFRLGLYHFWGTKAVFDKVKVRSNGVGANGDSEFYLDPTYGLDFEIIPYSGTDVNLHFGLQYDFKQTVESLFINLNGSSAAIGYDDGRTFENFIVYSNAVLNISNENQLYAGLNYSFPIFNSATLMDIEGGFGFQAGIVFKIYDKLSGDFGWRRTAVEIRQEEDALTGQDYIEMSEGAIYGFKLGLKYSF